MDVQIFKYKESQLEEIRIILYDFLSFIANGLSKPPWNFNLDVEHEVDFTMNNLDKFKTQDLKSIISKYWYAIYVRSRHEKSVHSELQQKDIESSFYEDNLRYSGINS